MGDSSDDFERAVAWLGLRVEADPALRAERRSSRGEFFAHRGDAAVGPQAERRHLEWFLCERPSASRGGTPIEALVHGEVQEDDEAPHEALAAWLASLASVFEVTGIAEGLGAWVRDLAGGGEYALEEPQASLAFEVGDLLVGRIFQIQPRLHRLSGAAGLFRDARLLEAVRNDLERARSSRRGTLRLSQADLERMFWSDPAPQPAPKPTLEDALARASVVLSAGGLAQEACEAIFEALRGAPQGTPPLLPGGVDALGEVLSQLAMESDVDLKAARAALLEVWSAYAHAPQSEPAPSASQAAARPRAADVRSAIEAFDRGRAEGRDLEELFRDLEQDLGLEDDESGDEELAPDFPGVVQAMVDEYLWELERESGEAAARAQSGLRRFGTFGAGVGVFENLTRRDLLVFASIWLPEFGELEDARAADELLVALEGFCSWCSSQHEFDLKSEFDAELSDMRDALPRLIDARRWFAPSAGPHDGALWLVRAVDGSRLTVVDAAGVESVVEVSVALASQLRADDWLRARKSGERGLEIYCAYPPQSARLRPAVDG
jgi:hypothetical protein